MKKAITAAIAAGIVMTVCQAGVSAASSGTGNEVFLCMRNGSVMAYQASNGGLLDYVEMKDSSGAIAMARVIDGSTYLPFRYIAETAGLTDASDSKSMGSNTFKYESRGKGSITIQTKNNRVSQDVGVPFEYTADDGTEFEYEIINIEGSLYFPMRYMAHIVGGEALYNGETGDIFFLTGRKTKNEYLTDDNYIKYKKLTALNYCEYDNALGYSDIYLQSDGETVSTVTDELRNNRTYYSVTRARKNLYYVDENYKVFSKKEGEASGTPITFYTTKNEYIDPYVDNIISYQNKLYGIAKESENSSHGRVFMSDLDGENFKYIGTTDDAYNLLLREYMGEGYIFYVDIESATEIHRINLSTGSDEKLSIFTTDPIEPIDILTLSDEYMIISEIEQSKIDIYTIDSGSIYKNSSISVSLDNEITSMNKATPIAKISSMNYDTDNNLVYFINNANPKYGLYCYDLESGKIHGLNTSQNVKRRISIIKMTETQYRVYHYSDFTTNTYKYDLVSVTNDGNIKLGNDITIER